MLPPRPSITPQAYAANMAAALQHLVQSRRRGESDATSLLAWQVAHGRLSKAEQCILRNRATAILKAA